MLFRSERERALLDRIVASSKGEVFEPVVGPIGAADEAKKASGSYTMQQQLQRTDRAGGTVEVKVKADRPKTGQRIAGQIVTAG